MSDIKLDDSVTTQNTAFEIRDDNGNTTFAVSNEGNVWFNGHWIESDEDFKQSFSSFSSFVQGVAFRQIESLLATFTTEQLHQLGEMVKHRLENQDLYKSELQCVSKE